jgi:hypothetical protein
MPVKTSSRIDMSGPFFTNDPRKTFRQNARVLLDRLQEEGEADVKQQMRGGEGGRAPISQGVSPSRVSGHVVGRVVSLTGRPWQATAVVSINNYGFSKAQGIALMAAAANVERETHAFRRTTNRLRRSRKVNASELLRGIA